MLTGDDIYRLAVAKAIKKGPTMKIIGGYMTAGYMLNRSELRELFKGNHYALRRSTWKDHISDWAEDYNAIVPPRKVLDDDNIKDWAVVFGLIDIENHKRLRMYAEDNDCVLYPLVAEGASA